MAYDANIDYSAKKAELTKQLAAATDAATKAALQAQIDMAEQSRTEKMASDLNAYGKYATGSELDAAAGIAAQNQIGTGYDRQMSNLNTSYDTAKQNANNDALSRGMARSSYVSDRLANLDSQRAKALSDIDASKALALQNAKSTILNNYRTGVANDLADQKTEFANTIGAYSNDYQAEINKVTGNNDASDDWKIPYLQQARNEKIQAQQAAALKAAKSSSGSGSGSGSGAGKPKLTAAQALAAYADAGIRTPEVIAAYTYYYGDPNYGTTYGDSVVNGLMSDIRKYYTNDAARVSYIDSLAKSGKITDAQEKQLLNSLGL